GDSIRLANQFSLPQTAHLSGAISSTNWLPAGGFTSIGCSTMRAPGQFLQLSGIAPLGSASVGNSDGGVNSVDGGQQQYYLSIYDSTAAVQLCTTAVQTCASVAYFTNACDTDAGARFAAGDLVCVRAYNDGCANLPPLTAAAEYGGVP
ncbi:MAG: hypothetical protein RLZZ403_1875, partial [Pseudomonadota bacterium]